MTPNLLIFTISAYILSLVLALILTFTSKKIPAGNFKYAAFIHFAFIALTILACVFKKDVNYHYLFILSCCSAISISGWAIRNNYLTFILRLYFGLSVISIVFFIISPSKLFYIVSGNYNLIKEEPEFQLRDNYYLVEQQSIFHVNNESVKYKIIQKLGIFNKTIAREIDFNGKPDSIHLLTFKNDTIILKAFNKNDSIERIVKTGIKEGTIIQKRN